MPGSCGPSSRTRRGSSRPCSTKPWPAGSRSRSSGTYGRGMPSRSAAPRSPPSWGASGCPTGSSGRSRSGRRRRRAWGRRLRARLERGRELGETLSSEQAALRVHNLLAGDLRSDGFQAFLLHEVFTELVRGASARLLTLTGERYSLRFDDEEIRVVDHDNADETRISDTLSGGETFLTSLALALELSDQVQRAVGAVNLDSLFIDEGFGTLDPDTLALASETLQSLRVGGRMVGVITHIPELRDEFAQQVIVIKHQGFSTVEVSGLAEPA